MTDTAREALERALNHYREVISNNGLWSGVCADEFRAARAALASEVSSREPVGWQPARPPYQRQDNPNSGEWIFALYSTKRHAEAFTGQKVRPLYATPVPSETQGLREAAARAVAFIASEYQDNRLEPEGEWLPPDARKIHGDLVAALSAPSPTPAPAKDWLANEIQESEKEFAASGESFKQSCALLEADFDTTSPAPARPDLRLEEDAQGRRAMLGGYQMSDEFIPSLEAAPAPASLDDVAEVEETCVGPKLMVAGVEVKWWFGTENNSVAYKLAEQVNAALRRAVGTVTDAEVALERCRTVLANMAQENEGALSMFNRWPIHHEPLRADAKSLLPIIDAALQAAAKARVP